MMVKITILNDDRNNNCNLDSEHGFSLYMEVNDNKLLMDAGQSDIYLKNASKLGINLDDVDAFMLSHGHYDHGNGLKYYNKKVKMIMHPNCISSRTSKRSGNYAGINQSVEELNEKFDLVMTKDTYKVCDNVYFLGEIDRNTEFEAKEFPTTNTCKFQSCFYT